MTPIELAEKLIPWFWILSGVCLGVVFVEKLRQLFKRRSCWFFGHDKNYVAMSSSSFWKNGSCGMVGHPIHSYHEDGKRIDACCFIASWICTKCGKMELECVGSVFQGAWRIEHGKVVPDEKAWADRNNKKWMRNT
jgi:hypothetical protein